MWCVHVCVYVVFACMWCMHVCGVCMYVSMYICMYVCMYELLHWAVHINFSLRRCTINTKEGVCIYVCMNC